MPRASISYSEYSMQSALLILAECKMRVRHELKTYQTGHPLFVPAVVGHFSTETCSALLPAEYGLEADYTDKLNNNQSNRAQCTN